MKETRCFFKSWIAKMILFSGYSAITLLACSFFKRARQFYGLDNINHERIHQVQQFECMIIGLILGIIFWAIFQFNPFWILLPTFLLFYLWYGLEYIIILAFAGWSKQNDRYHDVSFEEEAHNNDLNLDYLENRKGFAWLKYIKLRSYEK